LLLRASVGAGRTPTIRRKIWTRPNVEPPRNEGKRSESEKKNSRPSKRPNFRKSKKRL